MRKKLIVANWKMNLNTSQASLLAHRLSQNIKLLKDVEIVLAPNLLVLQPLSLQIDRKKFRLSAQNAYHKDSGPYTGEVSFTMLRDLVHYCLIGHSERRHIFGETNDHVRDKMAACVRNGIVPILCVGETKSERLDGETRQVVHDQLVTALANLTADEIETMAVAYEPVWAISGGSDYSGHQAPKPDEVAKVAKQIRRAIDDLYGQEAAEKIRVLYGGSSNAHNAADFLKAEGVDGLLVGGASLNYREFSKMVEIAHETVVEASLKKGKKENAAKR